MATVTVCSDFEAQENKICHCFYFSTFSLPWSDGTGCYDLNFFFNVEFQASFIFSNHCPLLPSSRGSLAPPGHGQPGDGNSEYQNFRN